MRGAGVILRPEVRVTGHQPHSSLRIDVDPRRRHQGGVLGHERKAHAGLKRPRLWRRFGGNDRTGGREPAGSQESRD